MKRKLASVSIARTGNHYVRYIYSNGVWEWWADNNGGSNGDTVDTYYGSRQC